MWRETTMAGQPFAANPLSKTSYPLQWLVVFVDPTTFLDLMILVHLFIAGVGMWRWAKVLGLRLESIVVATLAFVFAPRMVGHLAAGHLDIVYALAWWPWLMLCLHQLFKASDVGWYSGLQFGMVTALILLADVRVSFFAFLTSVTYLGLILRSEVTRSTIRYLVWGGLVSLVLTLAFIVPLGLWQPYLSRSAMTLNDAGALSLEIGQFIGIFLPANHSAVEALTYIGLPVLVLAVIGWLTRPRQQRIIGLVIILLIVLYALGTNAFLWPFLANIFSPLRWFRVPSRAWLVLVMLIPVMAGYGLQWVLDRVDDLKLHRFFPGLSRVRLILTSWIALSVLLGIFGLVALPNPISGLVVLISGTATGLLILLSFSQRVSTQRMVVLFVAIICFDLFVTGFQWLEWRSPNYWLAPQVPLAERLVELGTDRIYSPTFSLEQQVAEVYGLKMFGGVDPFQLEGVTQAVADGSGIPVTHYEVVLPPLTGVESDTDIAEANKDARINSEVLGKWHVSHIVAAYPIDNPRLQIVDQIQRIFIYRNLDYVVSPVVGAVPNWPDGWSGLPDVNKVQNFNQITILMTLISGIAWILCLVFIVYGLRSKFDG
ncbi:MAG: hypothetical protein R3E39_05410 [Anaerolineae bacterium]